MSGSFLAIGAGLVSSVEQALRGPGLTIGGIGLSEMEVPEKMTWGGQQQMVVHKIIGGQRVIDAMGTDDRTLEWSGLMRGSSAVARARSLDALRNSGAKQILTWADFTYTVVIQSFEADYTRQGYRVPYRISCIVIPQPRPAAAPGLLDGITSDISSALGLDGILPTVTSALGKAQSVAQAALPFAAVLTHGSSTYISLSSAVGTASGANGLVQSASEGSLGGLSSAASALGHLIPGTDALSGISALTAAGDAAKSLASSVTADGFIGRAFTNLTKASS